MQTHRAALALLLAGVAMAQETRVEHQRPLDPEGRLWEITPALRRQLQLFPEAQRFQAARLYQAEDSTWVLEISYQPGPWLSHQRRALSPAALDAFRRDLAQRRGRQGSGPALDQSGRGELIFDQMLLSLIFHGPAVITILDVPGGRPAVGCYMLTNAVGFYLPYRLTRARSVTPTHRQMTRFGAWGGIASGALTSDLILGDRGSERSVLAGAVAGNALSAVAGYRAVGWRGYTAGQGELCEVMTQLGALAGVGTALVADLYNDDDERRAGHALVLAGGGLGLYGGDRLGRWYSYTQGDAYVLRAGGLLGAVVALPLVNAMRTENPRAHAAGAVAGMGAGVAFTNRLLIDQEFSYGQGIIVTGAEVAGGLLGLGLTYLMDTKGHFDELAYLTSAAAGAAAGFTLTFRVLAR